MFGMILAILIFGLMLAAMVYAFIASERAVKTHETTRRMRVQSAQSPVEARSNQPR